MLFLSFALAVFAATANATSNVLQRVANRDEPDRVALTFRLIGDLVHRKVWLTGIGMDVLSFVLMATALRFGQLAAVQPIIVLELPLTLVGAWIAFRTRLGPREWAATALMAAGVAGLIGFLGPHSGNGGHVGGLTWAVGLGISGAVLAIVAILGVRARDSARAGLLGAASGIAFGISAALMKGMTGAYPQGVVGVLTAWQTYAMVLTGLLALYLMQNALQAGSLVAAQPGITLGDPTVAILWGTLAFHEQTRSGLFLGLASASALALTVGAVVLANSPMLQDDAGNGYADDRSRTLEYADGRH